MLPEQIAHPAKDQLIAFGQGKLAADDSSSVEQHLEHCRECCETLLDLKDDTFVGLVKIAQPSDSDRRMGTLARPAAESGKTEADKTGTGKSAHPTDGGIANDDAHSATMLVQSGEAIDVDELPVELQDHPRYRIVELIGRGGMGNVYRAEHRLMNRPVAIKLINSQLIRQPQAVERFRREVQAAAKLTHPNIVTAYDAEQAGDVHYLVMEFVEGTDLASVVKHRGPMSVVEACGCIRQVAEGLQHAHESGMVHRDIKPHNLMLSANGQVRILDFGLAGFASEAAFEGSHVHQNVGDTHVAPQSGDSGYIAPPSGDGGYAVTAAHLTTAGSVMGTPDYIAPEQAVDAHSADIRADIYSLGCTLHFLLTGKPPFVADNLLAKLKAHAESVPESLTTLRGDVPQGLSNVVARMMAKKLAERFQTPAAVAEALAPFAKPAASPPRRRVRSLVAALCMGVAALLAGVIFVQTSKGRVEIQSEVDDVEIVIKQGGEQIDFLDTKTGSQVKWLPSGEYEIKLKGDRNDIEIKGGNFTLSRWGTSIVTLKRKPEGLAADQPLKSNVDAQKPASHKLSAGWGDFINTDGASDVRESDGRVTITVPAGDRTYWSQQGPGSVPRLMQEVDGDFVAQVKVTLGRDSDKSHLFSASLAVWNHDRDFHTLTFTLYASNDSLSAMRFLDGPRGVTSSGTSGKSRIAHLKIERRNNELTTSWSRDGETWEKTKEPVIVNWPRKVQVGVAVNNRSTDELRVQFEELTITKDAPPPAIAPFDAEQAKKHQEAWARHLGVPVEYTNSIGMKFRLIPPGEFTMGSPPEEIEAGIVYAGDKDFPQRLAKSEGPQHKVILSQPRYVGIYEVTQAQYEKVMGKNPSHFAATGPGKDAVIGLDTTNHPVELVSWHEAVAFCAKLSQQEKQQPDNSRRGDGETQLNGVGYRLLTEAEWEFSCRAGSTMKYSSGDGDEQLDQIAWIGRNSGDRTHAAGELRGNPFGIHDIHGNVWEWCQDPWELTYYGRFQEQPALDPNGPQPNDAAVRVMRGGAFGWPAFFCRASNRHTLGAEVRLNQIGFRVSLDIEAVRQASQKSAKTDQGEAVVDSLGPEELKVLKAAEAFLAVADEGNFDKLYDIGSNLAKKQAKREQVVPLYRQIRDTAGKVEKRSLRRVQLIDKFLGLPPGRYAAVQYASDFEKHKGLWETVMLNVDDDGQWRVNTYAATVQPLPLPEPKSGSATKSARPSVPTPPPAIKLGENLVTDPSLEETAIGQKYPLGWGTGNVNPPNSFKHQVVEGGRTGQRGWLIEGNGQFAVIPTNRPSAHPAYRYAATAWVRIESGSAQIKLLYFDGQGQYIGENRGNVSIQQDGWHKLTMVDDLKSYPEARSLSLALTMTGVGKAVFDDLELLAFDASKLPEKFEATYGAASHHADVFDRWVGRWESTTTYAPTAATPDERVIKGETIVRKVLSDRFLLWQWSSDDGQSQYLTLLCFNDNTQAYQIWLFGSGGEVFDRTGQWNAASQTLTLQVKPSSPGVTGMSTDRFVSQDRIESTLLVKGSGGQVTRDMRATWIRKSKTVEDEIALADGPRADVSELAVLQKMVGRWSVRQTIMPCIAFPNGDQATGTEHNAWVLGGRFFLNRAYDDQQRLTSLALQTYDPVEKTYQHWHFAKDVFGGQWRITWDASSRAFHWRSIDMPAGWIGTGFNRWINDDTFDNQALIKDENGRTIFDSQQDKRRKK